MSARASVVADAQQPRHTESCASHVDSSDMFAEVLFLRCALGSHRTWEGLNSGNQIL